MPLFNRKHAQKIKEDPSSTTTHHRRNEHDDHVKQNLVFHCQQAQGSPTGLVSNFSNVRELYQRVADCYDFSSDQVSSPSPIRYICYRTDRIFIFNPRKPYSICVIDLLIFVSTDIASRRYVHRWDVKSSKTLRAYKFFIFYLLLFLLFVVFI